MGLSCFLQGFRPYQRRKKKREELSKEAKADIYNRIDKLAHDWDRGHGYEYVKAGGWNNWNTFEWLWRKYTGQDGLDPSYEPINYADVRRFKIGLDLYNRKLKRGIGFIKEKWFLPRSIMKNFPELAKFEMELVNETQFFRDYSNTTGNQINEFLNNFKELSLDFGGESWLTNNAVVRGFKSGGRKEYRKLADQYSSLLKQLQVETNPNKKRSLENALHENSNQLMKFYKEGSGEAFVLMDLVLQGADINTLKRSNGQSLNSHQTSRLENMLTNYVEIRKQGATGLIRGLQKIKSMAKKKNMYWAEQAADKIDGLIKSIEFQKVVDENNQRIDRTLMGDTELFIKTGLKLDGQYTTNDGKTAFSRHYMTKYTLGLLDIIQKIHLDMHEGKLSIDEQLRKDMEQFDKIVNVAKNQSPIKDRRYDADPFFFLKQYTQSVGTFNYKAHLKDTFQKTIDKIQYEHLAAAKESKNQNVINVSESMLNLLKDVYREVHSTDGVTDGYVNDMMRIMTSVTYFRLMGGNIRSGLRNATQRAYEWVMFGAKASLIDAPSFYRDSGLSARNVEMLVRQQRKYGLQWYDGKTKSAQWLEAAGLKEGMENKLSESSRGALEDAYAMDKYVYVAADGNIKIKSSERVTEKVARGASSITQKAGIVHRVVEDWNRGNTFKVAFALAFTNINSGNRDAIARKMLSSAERESILRDKPEGYQITWKDVQQKYGKDAEAKKISWVENKAGQIAFNSVLDIHFEYAKWAKAKAIKMTAKDEETALGKMWGGTKVTWGQFRHYKWSLFDMAWNVSRDALIAARAGALDSPEMLRPAKFAMLQASIWGATLVFNVNLQKLMPFDLFEEGEALYQLASASHEGFTNGELSPEKIKAVNDATYGQGFKFLLGANFPIIASAYESVQHMRGIDADPTTGVPDPEGGWHRQMFGDSVEKAINSDEVQKNYNKLAKYNVAAARAINYSSKQLTEGNGVIDFMRAELGFFLSKEQREDRERMLTYLGLKKPKKKRRRKPRLNDPLALGDVGKALDALQYGR